LEKTYAGQEGKKIARADKTKGLIGTPPALASRRRQIAWRERYILPSRSNITIINNTNPIPPLG
jgi:hypothetical protein